MNGDLRELAARRTRLHAVDAELRGVDAQLRQLRSSGQRWQRQAERAAHELARLRGWSPAALLARLTGRAAAQRAVQEQRVDEARAEQDALETREAPFAARRAVLAAERDELLPVTAQHAAALRAIEARVRAAGGEDAARCEQSAAALERLQRDARDADRAVERARAAATALAAARDGMRLPNAQLGRPLGFGPFGSRERASRFDGALEHVARAQRELQELGVAVGSLEGLEGLAPGAGTALLQLAGGSLLGDAVGRAQFAAARERIAAQLEHVRELTLGLERRAAQRHAATAAASQERERWLESLAPSAGPGG